MSRWSLLDGSSKWKFKHSPRVDLNNGYAMNSKTLTEQHFHIWTNELKLKYLIWGSFNNDMWSWVTIEEMFELIFRVKSQVCAIFFQLSVVRLALVLKIQVRLESKKVFQQFNRIKFTLQVGWRVHCEKEKSFWTSNLTQVTWVKKMDQRFQVSIQPSSNIERDACAWWKKRLTAN